MDWQTVDQKKNDGNGTPLIAVTVKQVPCRKPNFRLFLQPEVKGQERGDRFPMSLSSGTETRFQEEVMDEDMMKEPIDTVSLTQAVHPTLRHRPL